MTVRGGLAGRPDLAARTRLPPDARLILAGQGVRAFGYGLGAVLLGRTLAALHVGGARAGLVLAAAVAGSAVASVLVAYRADRAGRRRCYAALYPLVAVTGAGLRVRWYVLAAGGRRPARRATPGASARPSPRHEALRAALQPADVPGQHPCRCGTLWLRPMNQPAQGHGERHPHVRGEEDW